MDKLIILIVLVESQVYICHNLPNFTLYSCASLLYVNYTLIQLVFQETYKLIITLSYLGVGMVLICEDGGLQQQRERKE